MPTDGRGPVDRTSMTLTALAEHEDKAAALLPAEVYDYFAAGAGAETTLHESRTAWEHYRVRPRVLRDVGRVDLPTSLLGAEVSSPVVLAPTAFQGLAHAEGERATARAAAATGSLLALSTRSSTPLEEVAAAGSAPWWFQVYAMRDRDLTLRLVERAVSAGARALVLTGDTPYVGIKRRVTGTRIAIPDDHFLVNLQQHLDPGRADARRAAEQDPTITLEAISWLAEASGLPVLVKGVLRGDEAVACLDAGAAGVVVSNHGGRQLDRAVPSAIALPEVVDAVAGRAPVLVDGGIRSGLDCLVALALGASAVMVGRPVVWGLAAGGEAGVVEALEALRADLTHVMALTGAASLADLDRSLVTATSIWSPL
ncbi:alpha-hydroxy-acid oxidizing protein [Actinotalea sp. BY-33]|uniref:Alpha-hydroxy-acid oxidizing protein n=1 Tax=Actinotalea soli TaxID=2819234 RepID=A0A939LSP7_9CELL|nr:alpha-hydroxy acid oxidase [Actinotalea soli]MBO1751995.1 alpha-hydroxy-acid oxidizing protein [Actinotalea soli]